MPGLKVVKGYGTPGLQIPLRGERAILGRHPNCEIVLDDVAVSRNHAQILESHGTFFLEDLRSRNGTFLNGERLRARVELRDGDEIRISETVFVFGSGGTTLTGNAPARDQKGPANQYGGGESPFRMTLLPPSDEVPNSSVIASVDMQRASSHRVRLPPEEQLRAVLRISRNLASTLDLDVILPKLLEELLEVFPTADRGVVALHDAEQGTFRVRSVRTRGPDDTVGNNAVSQTILREAINLRRAILSSNAPSDFHTESVAALRIRSILCAPLISRNDEVLGAIELSTRDLNSIFTQDDLDLFACVALQASMAIDNAQMHHNLMRQRDLDRELEFATQVQLGFLPTDRPNLAGYQFFDHYEAAYRVGGDFFDYVTLPDGRVAVSVGDVAGKGVAAALLMARIYAVFRYELLARSTVTEALAALNANICASALGHRFVTLVLAVIDPRGNEVCIVNAGHLPPIYLNAEGQTERLAIEQSGLPLGIVPDTKYREFRMPFHSGDTLVLYTDGVTEAMNENSEIFGIRRLEECVAQADRDVDKLGEAVMASVQEFCDDRPQRDDLCLICFRREK